MTVLLAGVSVYRASALNAVRETNGSYHIVFNGLDKQQLVSIRNLDIFEQTEMYSVSSYTSSTDVDYGQMQELDATMEYLVLNGQPVDNVFLRFREEELTMLPDSISAVTEGRLPEKDGEIVIAASNAYMWDYPEIGDTVTAELITCKAKGSGETVEAEIPEVLSENFDVVRAETISFTVVGFSLDYNIVDYSDTRLKSYSYLSDNLLARFSDKADDLYWDMHYAFADIGYEIDDFSYGMNQELMDLEGKGVTAKFSAAVFFGLVYLVIIFIMFCVRMVIDNAFEISAKERVQQFGLLKAVGASRKQVLKLTLWEALYLAVPGVICGILLGYACAGGIFTVLKNHEHLHNVSADYDLSRMLVFDVKPYVFITAAVIGVLWVCVSAVSTGMRSIKASPVEAMRSAGRHEKISIPKKPSKLSSGAGFIGAYSSLSIKRNKKRYLITIVSMVMSITLFAGFSYGTDIAEQKLKDEFESVRRLYNYTIYHSALTAEGASEQAAKMQESGYFTDVQYDAKITLFGEASAMGVSPSSKLYSTGSAIIDIHPVNRETYEKYISGNMSYDELVQSGKILVCTEMYYSEDDSTETVYDTLPESITAAPFVSSIMNFLDSMTFETAGSYTSENNLYRSADGIVTAVIPEENYAKALGVCGIDNSTNVYPAEDGTEYNVYHRTIFANAAEGYENSAKNYLDRHFYGSYTDNTGDMNMAYSLLETVKVVGYFIVAVISMIAAVNIVNIISANVLNRTSEFAMLRACGMSGRQLHLLILREGLMYAFKAGVISLILTELTVFLVQIPFKTHFHDLTMEDMGVTLSYTAPMGYILIAAAAAFIIAAAASYFPARRIIKSPIVDSVYHN